MKKNDINFGKNINFNASIILIKKISIKENILSTVFDESVRWLP